MLGPAIAQCAYGGGACQVQTSEAVCPAGTALVGGGFTGTTPDDDIVFAGVTNNNTWGVIGVNFWNTSATIQASAICARGSARALQSTGTDIAALVAEMRSKL